MDRITPDNITALAENEIFVFGSNLAGRPGAGAAKFAQTFGMRYGHTNGVCGQTYAIPTKDENIQTMPIEQIQLYVTEFVEYAKQHPELIFLVTEIGCGLAGYHPYNIAPLFQRAIGIANIHLPKRFWDVLTMINQNNA